VIDYLFGRSTRVSHEVKWVEIAIGLVLVAILAVPPL
jgi:hypothetical protein